MIRFENVNVEFNNKTLLKDINITIKDGEVVSIIGPSGTGKSIFLRLINQLDRPTSGKIFIDDIDITDSNANIIEIRKKIGMVFQNYNIFNNFTVIENVANPQIDVLNKDPKEAYELAIKLLSDVGLSSKKNEYTNELSSGQKQRVAIARAVSMNPSIILLDDPTSALDPTMLYEVEAIIDDLVKKNKTMIIVTHDMNLAKKVSTRVLYMDDNTIYEEGTPEDIFNNPKKENTKIFINNLRLLIINIDSKECDFWSIGSEIDKYAIKNHFSSKKSARLRLAFEELVREIILTKLKNIKLNIVVEYSEKESTLKMKLKYDGEYFNPKDTDNTLSYNVLKSTVSNMIYKKLENDNEYKNEVELIITN